MTMPTPDLPIVATLIFDTNTMMGVSPATAARPEGSLLMMQSNAGLPELVGSDVIYNGTPVGMTELAETVKSVGIDVVGSCCGSAPRHTAAIRSVMFD